MTLFLLFPAQDSIMWKLGNWNLNQNVRVPPTNY